MLLRSLFLSTIVLLSTLASAGHYEKDSPPPNNPSGGGVLYDYANSPQYVAYGPVGQGYGGGAQGSYYSYCYGTITTNYHWVRDRIDDPNNSGNQMDDPLDEPPAEIIVMESCAVSACAYSSWSEPVFASCDNGLGFSPTITSDDYSMLATCSGTRYRKLQGAETITLTCSPTATADSDGHQAISSVEYSSQIFAPSVRVVGTTRFEDPVADLFLTGQQLRCSIVGLPTGISVSSYQWDIAGTKIDADATKGLFYKDYNPYLSSNQLIKHSSADWRASTLHFYCAGKKTFKVKCELTLAFPPEVRLEGFVPRLTVVSRQQDCRKPDLYGSDPLIGLVSIVGDLLRLRPDPSDPRQTEGMNWLNIEIDVQKPFGPVGTFCTVQLINPKRVMIRHAPSGFFTTFTYSPINPSDYVLDVSFPYSGPWPIGIPGLLTDSPAQNLAMDSPDAGGNDWFDANVEDKFKTFAMYLPPPGYDGQTALPTTWVPISMLQWSWKAHATKTSGFWSLDSGSRQCSDPSATNFHPTWTAISPHPIPVLAYRGSN